MMKTFPRRNLIICLLTCIAGVNSVYSQVDSAGANAYEALSLKDLLSIKIVSASKSSESLFDAPLSASVVTREEIRKAGSTSIMEALRLVPGMIVLEQSNGNYDIYLRGMNNVPPNGAFDGGSNTTLVMMNNRPIYNYLKGGTFWETIPVDLDDVERIEVIRGPAAALYGPNAVSGVINIITRKADRDGLSVIANSRTGSNHTLINNASIGYRFNNKWSLIGSGNYQKRDRSQSSYYDALSGEWVTGPENLSNMFGGTTQTAYPDPELAMKKYAGNVFLTYDPSGKTKFDFSAGAQHSLVQGVSTENGSTPLNTIGSNSRYADLHAQINALSGQFSYNEGTQVPDHRLGNKYDFKTFDANLEYNYTRNKLSIKPGLAYRRAVYDDTKYSDMVNKTGIFNARGQLTTTSGSLRSEYKLLSNRLRLVAGLTASQLTNPDSTYLSYEFAATWKVNKKHIFRAVYSKAPRAATIYDAYVNQTLATIPMGPNKISLMRVESERNLKLLTAGMFEIGYRGIINSHFSVDVEVYQIHSKNYSAFIPNDPYIEYKNADTFLINPIKATNLPMKLFQRGMTVSMNYASSGLVIKPFVTVQHSQLIDYSGYAATPGATPDEQNPDPGTNNIYSGIGTKKTAEGTPSLFGGAYVNYSTPTKWNFNLNTYYYSAYTYYHVSGKDHIKAKCILNANVSYDILKNLSLSLTAKNILNNKSREFFRTDRVPFMIFGGVSYELK